MFEDVINIYFNSGVVWIEKKMLNVVEYVWLKLGNCFLGVDLD